MTTLTGLILAFLGGGIQGAFVYPMKFMRHWRWENGWLAFTIFCCLIIPPVLAFMTIPDLLSIYQRVDGTVITLVFLFGVGWGIGVILFGLGAEFLGMALGIAIITGINACLGTLIPLLFLPVDTFNVKAGFFLGFGLILLVLGVILLSVAGKMRENDQRAEHIPSKVPFRVGLLVCLIAALFCPSSNFAVFFGQPISEAVNDLGTVAPHHVAYAQLLPFFIGGSVAQIIYCLYLLKKHNSFKKFFIAGAAINWAKGFCMSAIFIAGMVLYTIATVHYIPEIGPVIGWPLFMAATIIMSNGLGLLSKEWRGVGRKAFLWLYAGIVLLIAAIILCGISNLYLAD